MGASSFRYATMMNTFLSKGCFFKNFFIGSAHPCNAFGTKSFGRSDISGNRLSLTAVGAESRNAAGSWATSSNTCCVSTRLMACSAARYFVLREVSAVSLAALEVIWSAIPKTSRGTLIAARFGRTLTDHVITRSKTLSTTGLFAGMFCGEFCRFKIIAFVSLLRFMRASSTAHFHVLTFCLPAFPQHRLHRWLLMRMRVRLLCPRHSSSVRAH